MKPLFLFLFILTSFSCSKKTYVIYGKYETSKEKTFNRLLNNLSFKSYYVGIEIMINSDSSFEYKNCSQKINGSWKISNDSLQLFCNKRKFIIDSLNNSIKYSQWTKCDSLPLVYKIKRNHLIREEKIENKSVFENLKKNQLK
ncbi:hypothetical protein [Flavobacterium sp.]|uniref:hypothetical protein n=1 Tax=Flavobacterium sp. TaxID=239 RepID=UPI00375036C2